MEKLEGYSYLVKMLALHCFPPNDEQSKFQRIVDALTDTETIKIRDKIYSNRFRMKERYGDDEVVQHFLQKWKDAFGLGTFVRYEDLDKQSSYPAATQLRSSIELGNSITSAAGQLRC